MQLAHEADVFLQLRYLLIRCIQHQIPQSVALLDVFGARLLAPDPDELAGSSGHFQPLRNVKELGEFRLNWDVNISM
jgi:hypothetical protein